MYRKRGCGFRSVAEVAELRSTSTMISPDSTSRVLQLGQHYAFFFDGKLTVCLYVVFGWALMSFSETNLPVSALLSTVLFAGAGKLGFFA